MRNVDGAGYEGFGEWSDLSEALIRGLSHGLTNRVSSIGSFVQLHGMGDKEFTVETFLPKESSQLQQIARVLRFLVIDGEVSAVELKPILFDAIALYSHHSRMHLLRCEVDGLEQQLPPIRVVRSAMLRLLVILLDMTASEVSIIDTMEVRLTVSATQEELTVSAPCRRAPSPYAQALAEQSGASLLSRDDMFELRIPTLLALRAR